MKSSLWVYLSRWLSKLCGIISTLILARILTTDDFGIVATVAIVTSLFNTLSTTGSIEYLLRRKIISDQDLNTSWSINMIMKTFVAIGVFFCAEPAANFFNDHRIIDVLRVSSFILFISSFNNIGMIRHQKNMNFKPQFQLDVYSQIITLFIKVALAVYLQNYWAFVLAELASTVIRLLLTYKLHTFRPKFSLTNWQEQWSYSQWILAKGIFSNIRFKIDNIIIAKSFPAASLGIYTVAKDIATTPVGQIVTPIIQPLYVGLAKHLNEPEVFADKLHKTMLSSLLLIFPIAFGISVLAENIVKVLLGDKWLEAIPVIQVIAFVILSGMLNNLMTQILNLLGKTKQNFYLDIALGLLTISTFILLASYLTISEFALVRVILGFITFVCVITYISFVSSLNILRLSILSIPILCCAVFMYYSVDYFNMFITLNNQIFKLALLILLGALTYVSSCFIVVKLIKKYLHEYEFVWKTAFIPVLKQLKR